MQSRSMRILTGIGRYLWVGFCGVMLLAACQPAEGGQSATPVALNVPTLAAAADDPGIVAPRATPDLSQLPLLAAHLEDVRLALQQPVPILPLDEGLDSHQRQAQAIALADPQFTQYARDTQTQAPLRSEIFGIYPLRESDITEFSAPCTEHTCYRVELYNYALNIYLAAIVDLDTETVVDRIGMTNAQPDIPAHLIDIALEIARSAPQVVNELGYQPDPEDARMASTKSALNETLCERSHHLCVAPTFVVGEYALWAIVDLTDSVLVGVRWTNVGSKVEPITEKALENESIMRRYCQQNTPLERDGWQMDYILTSSDGLRIADVRFQDRPMFKSAKLVDWHVNYSSTQGFGYSDAVGCPVFSQAAVIAVQPPVVEDIRVDGEVVGFALEQDFWSELWPQPCNYYYQQRYEFYHDGRFRPIVTSLGRGCGDDGTYRPVTRIALAGEHTFSQWNGSDWEIWAEEGWRLAADIPANDGGYQMRLSSAGGSGFYVIPDSGQFAEGGRGDNPYIYITLNHPDRDEGESDLTTIGPCCNEDYRQGPERFIEPEPDPIAEDSPLVLWYVAQLKNSGTPGEEYCWAESILEDGLYVPRAYPCHSGPMLVPITGATNGA